MSETKGYLPAHSPAPFQRIATEGGHLILDDFGDSIAALARRSGDHSPEEQLANAQLFQAAPLLLAVARSVEWAAQEEMVGGGWEPSCPHCGETKRAGHSIDCDLREALDLAEPTS